MSKFQKNDRVLILGGTGFIGRHLAARCLEDTSDVTVLGVSKSPNEGLIPKGVSVLQADITDRENLKSVLSGSSFDYVFNLSGYIDHTPFFKGGRKVIEAHFTGLMNLLDCLNKEDLKGFVQIGSSDEYGGAVAPQREDVREMPISPYSFAKTAASHFIMTLSGTEKFPGAVLRLFLTYGPMQDERRFLPQIIKGCLNGGPFKVSEGRQLRDFCYVSDAVEAMVRAAIMTSAKGHIINIGSGSPVSIREMIETVVRLVGRGEPLWGGHPYREGENMALYADTDLSKTLLDWRPAVSLNEGLRRTIDYYRNRI